MKNISKKLNEISSLMASNDSELEKLIDELGRAEEEFQEAKRMVEVLKFEIYEKLEFIDTKTEHLENENYHIKVVKNEKKVFDDLGILQLKEKYPDKFEKIFKQETKYKPNNKAIDTILEFGGTLADDLIKIRTIKEGKPSFKIERIRDEEEER